MNPTKLPSNRELAWGTICVMRRLGRPALIYEINDQLAQFLHVPSSIRRIRHGRGPEFEFDYRAEWIRTNLKNLDAIYNSSRGEWTLTRAGRALRPGTELYRKLVQKYGHPPFPIDRGPNGGPRKRKHKCLKSLRNADSTSFKTICRKFLIKSGFQKINITGMAYGSAFGGTAIFSRNGILVSIRCQRSVRIVDSIEIVNFRKAMAGRSEKGLLITTSSFTESARKEATRIGALEIVLIDGIKLCNILKKMNIQI